MKIFIIAEAGVNHNGSLEIAKKLIDVSSLAGADAVKFQTFRADRLVTATASRAEYQIVNTGTSESQFEMLEKLELSPEMHRELFSYCNKKNIVFMSTPFDETSVDFLDNLGMQIFKIPSGELTNLPYLRKVGSLKKKVILSTGMADLGEIKDALEVLVTAGTEIENITVLHCNTEYPTPIGDVNLQAMITIRNAFKVNAGYSDHTLGIEVPIAAVALGAKVLEKHFTLDRNMQGPDHEASVEPEVLKLMVKAIRNTEKALGSGIKAPSRSEIKNRLVIRKSIIAARDIKSGESFTIENITVKRPGTGINPMEWDNIIGRKAKRDFKEDDLIKI